MPTPRKTGPGAQAGRRRQFAGLPGGQGAPLPRHRQGAPFNGGPWNRAPLNGAPLNGALDIMVRH